MNNWQAIWNKREDNFNLEMQTDYKKIFEKLLLIDGFDLEGGLPIESWLKYHEDLKTELDLKSGESVFEVGCGAGAQIFMFEREGLKVGGLDYSEKLLSIQKKVLPDDKVIERICDEAKNLPTEIKYDAIFSTGVFIYFDSLDYAKIVLEKMLAKAKRRIGILDVYDAALKEECLAYRRKTIPNYDECYKNLDKLFIPKKFFEDFATENKLKIWFKKNELEGYGNSPFTYHCYFEL